MENNSELIIYTTEDGLTKVDVTFDNDTVWLSLDQMANLFQRDKSTISRHIKNVFEEGELDRNSVVANFATTAADGKKYQVDYYNLDVIISVGYRVKSQRGVQFRIWASEKVFSDRFLKYTQQALTTIQKKLFELQDKEYALFQAKLTPTVNPELFIGVRVPACRALAKDLYKNDTEEVKRFCQSFLISTTMKTCCMVCYFQR